MVGQVSLRLFDRNVLQTVRVQNASSRHRTVHPRWDLAGALVSRTNHPLRPEGQQHRGDNKQQINHRSVLYSIGS